MVFNIYNIFFCLLILCIISLLVMLRLLLPSIPNYQELNKYIPTQITRVYDSTGQVLDEYAKEKRIYIEYHYIPKLIINAFIAVEDKNFFSHQGVDFSSILRAFLQNILRIGAKKRLIGGSTITQQVVKGFFLTNERSVIRKCKEVILSYKISRSFSKEKILEIYLNQIYLGCHSYGIYVAAHNYFGKNLEQINIEEAALLASLPKAPSILNPYKSYQRALTRRNWAIQRIQKEGYITLQEKSKAIKSTIRLANTITTNNKFRSYYTESVKSELLYLFSKNILYSKGLIINTNINLKIQDAAQKALKNGLKQYDKSQGWRGRFATIDLSKNFLQEIMSISKTRYHDHYLLGAITKINKDSLEVILSDNKSIILSSKSFEWIFNQSSASSQQLKQSFQPGDVILLDKSLKENYKIEQIPEINGAIIVIENISGKILSIVGGYDYAYSKFNRAIQAYRQPGSIFKPFVYLAAFEDNMLPNTLILDEPIAINLNYKSIIYKPKNYSDKYYGAITLRTSFEQSRNLSTLRLLFSIGLDKISKIAKKYLIYSLNIKPNYSIALGAYETTLLKLTSAYSSIANRGIIKQPKLIDSIYDRKGNVLYVPKDIYRVDSIKCTKYYPQIGYLGIRLTNDAMNYKVLSLLEGVVKRGSAKRAKILKRSIAGKTGTTNNSFDTWFIGMTPDITIGVFVGFDTPKNMGKYATGSNVALPIFINFFRNLDFIPRRHFNIPESINHNYIDIKTGSIVIKKDFIKENDYIIENFIKKQKS